MARMLKAVVLGGVLIGVAGTAAPSRAWTDGGRTMYITFSGPVALPGVALGAGTYIFELALPDSNTSLVRVSSRDHRRVYLTAFTNLVGRPTAMRPGQVISLGEHAADAPPPVRVWYPTGSNDGRQFIYRN
jgi:hypothetical protein